MHARNPSGNFGSHDDDDDDAVHPSWSAKTRAKHRAEELSMWAVGSISEADDYLAQAQGEIKWDGLCEVLRKDGWQLVEEYIYHGPDGAQLYEAVRFQYRLMPSKKKFYLKHTNYENRIVINAGPVRVPYNLPDVLARKGEPLVVVEGEKACNLLKAKGLRVTCIQGQFWTDDVCQFFAGEDVVLAMDADDGGNKATARALDWLGKVDAKVRVPDLKLPPRNGLDDWLATHTVEEFWEVCNATRGTGLNITPYNFPDETSLPMWDFMLGTHLLRGTVSGTAAMGGTGKSSLGIVEAMALALCSGKTIPGIEPPGRPQRVWLINFEDNRNAMDKRIAAAMKHYGLSPADFGDRLHVAAKGEFIATLAKQIRNGTVERNEPLIQSMVALLQENKIDVVSIDPFINSHRVNENDNFAIREVVECFGVIADQANCAAHLWHHTRKGNGQGATIDAARGAIAFVDACRCVRVLETMTKEDALKLNIIHPGFYFRAFNGKLNFAPPVEQSDWYKFENVELDNGGMLFGDSVGVVTAWQRPATLVVELTPYVIDQIRQRVGPPPVKWRAHSTADMWVGIPVAEVLELDPVADVAAIKLVIPKLVKAKALKRVTAQDRTRQDRQWYVAGASAPEDNGGAL